jgi:hypothetical protein
LTQIDPMLAQDKDRSCVIITFGEFLEMWKANGRMYIPPEDRETKDKNQLGVVPGRHFQPIVLSEKAGEVWNGLIADVVKKVIAEVKPK